MFDRPQRVGKCREVTLAREVHEIMGAERAVARWSAAKGEEGFGDLIGAMWLNETDVRRGGEHAGNRAPARGEDRQVVRERLDERERLAFVRIGGRETKNVGGSEEVFLLRFVGETDVANDVGAELGRERAERVGVVGVRKAAGDGEAKGAGFVAVRESDGGERIEEALFAGAKTEEEDFGWGTVWGFEFVQGRDLPRARHRSGVRVASLDRVLG